VGWETYGVFVVCVMPPPPLLGPPPPLCGSAPVVGAMLMPGLMPGPPGAGAVVGPGDGLGIGAALTASIPNISGDTATPAAIAAALATRFRFIGFRFPRRLLCAVNVLVNGYPANAETNPAAQRNDVAIGLTTG
jgi:hypothetical protein